LIKLQGYRSIPRRRIELNYLSHPDIGNLNAITDTLQRLDVQCEAIEASTITICSFKEPLLVLLHYDKKLDYYLIKIQDNNRIQVFNRNNNWKSISKEEFDKIYYGVVVLCGRNEKKENLNFRFSNKLFPYLLLCSFLIYGYSLSGNIFQFIFFTLSFFGLYVAISTYIYQFRRDLGILGKMCNSDSKTDCQSVIFSKFSNVFFGITFSDLAIMYFLFQLFYYVIFKDEQNGLLFPFFISLLSIPITFYSIYLQKFVIKRWCLMCLFLVIILYLQALISIKFILSSDILFSLNDGYNIIFSSFLATSIWYVIKPVIKKTYTHDLLEIEYLKFKRNYKLFISSLLNEKEIFTSDMPTTLISESGKKNLLRLTLVINPTCHLCITAIESLKKILSVYKNDINLNVLFYVSIDKKTDYSVLKAISILDSIKNIPDNGINILQKHISISANTKEYENIINKESYDLYYQNLVKHHSWCIRNGINATPTLLIGNRLFPSNFDISDLHFFMDDLIQMQIQSKLF
jgi:uncharacterized membrane protein